MRQIVTKWSGAFALPLVGGTCVVLASFAGQLRRQRSTAAIVGTLTASFVLVPLSVYLVSYGAFFFQHGLAIGDFLHLQSAMLRYQQAHLAIQPENSAPWTWPLLLHPVRYIELVRGGSPTGIVVALGNPVLWWESLLLLPVAVVHIVRRATWQDAIRLRRLRGDVPAVVRHREDAVHLVHAACRPLHVPRCRRHAATPLPPVREDRWSIWFRRGDGAESARSSYRCGPAGSCRTRSYPGAGAAPRLAFVTPVAGQQRRGGPKDRPSCWSSCGAQDP